MPFEIVTPCPRTTYPAAANVIRSKLSPLKSLVTVYRLAAGKTSWSRH